MFTTSKKYVTRLLTIRRNKMFTYMEVKTKGSVWAFKGVGCVTGNKIIFSYSLTFLSGSIIPSR